MNKTFVFPSNTINYSQDFRSHRGIPSGVKFFIEDTGASCRLIAPGYGDNKDYGNGAIYVDARTLRVVLEYLQVDAA